MLDFIQNNQEEFEDNKKNNEDALIGELSFEENQLMSRCRDTFARGSKMPEEEIKSRAEAVDQNDAESSQFSLGAPTIEQSQVPIIESHENVVDQQLKTLANRLIGLVNKERY